METLPKPSRQRVDRAVIMLAVVGLALAGAGVWLYAHDRPALEVETRLNAQRTTAQANLAKSQSRIAELNAELVTEQDKVERSAKIVTELEQLENTWSWFGGNRAQAKVNAERLEHMKAFQATASAKGLSLRQEIAQTTWQRDQLKISLQRIESHLQAEAARKSEMNYHVSRAWLRARSWLIIAAAVYVLGPMLWRFLNRRRDNASIRVGVS